MSQCDRILEVLRDGQWHRMEEIHQHAGFMRLNSRVSDLRNRGHRIECDKSGGTYSYRLLRAASPPSSGGDGERALEGSLAARSNAAVAPLSPGRVVEPLPTVADGDPAPSLFEIPRKPSWA